MGDFNPLRFFQRGPSFQDFIIAAERVKPEDDLVLKNGRLEKKSGYEPNEEKCNKRTWQAFRSAIKREFTETKRKHICARYGFDWDKLIHSSLPLQRHFVEYFGVGAANAYTFNLQESLDSFSWLAHLVQFQPIESIHCLYQHATRLRFLGNIKDPSNVHGGVDAAHENFTYDKFRTDKRRANLYRGIEELVSHDPNIPRLHPYYSRLSMGIVSQLETQQDIIDKELVIPAPGAVDGKLEYLKILDIISDGGLTAVALVPVSEKSKLSPILSFRCTKQTVGQTDFFPSLLNNMEEIICESGYKKCCEKFDSLMKNPNFTRGKKVTVLGYSQGGGYAGYFLRDHWRQVKEFVGFNIVGGPSHVVENLANEINVLNKSEIPPSIITHRNIAILRDSAGNIIELGDDWVNKIGDKHIGWGITHPNARVKVFKWEINNYPAPSENVSDIFLWMNLHAVRPMDPETEEKSKSKFESQWHYLYELHTGPTQCNRILDTYNHSQTLEDMRKRISKLFYKFIDMSYLTLDFILRSFGIEFFKKSL